MNKHISIATVQLLFVWSAEVYAAELAWSLVSNPPLAEDLWGMWLDVSSPSLLSRKSLPSQPPLSGVTASAGVRETERHCRSNRWGVISFTLSCTSTNTAGKSLCDAMQCPGRMPWQLPYLCPSSLRQMHMDSTVMTLKGQPRGHMISVTAGGCDIYLCNCLWWTRALPSQHDLHHAKVH